MSAFKSLDPVLSDSILADSALSDSTLAKHAQGQMQQFLSFYPTASANPVMVPTTQLTEVLTLTPQQIVPIPQMDAAVMGVCNWRGEVLWLLDLACLLNGQPLPPPTTATYSAIILHHDTHLVGLVVSQITQMLWCPPAAIQPLPPNQPTSKPSPFLQGYWVSPQSETILVLNSSAIFAGLQR
jgi:positive phototaxis protein PixI